MRKSEIKAWAYRAVDRVKAGQQLEDALLEAKAAWIEPAKAARRIAGHCNAARGAPVLWLFGLDESRGVVGVPPQDLASWWPSVVKEFQGPVPVPHDMVVESEGKALVALLFETDQPPYVVKNRGGGAELEVPWREGTGVISARHEHLIRLLSPLATLPKIELVEGALAIVSNGGITPTGGNGPSWKVKLHLYVTPGTDGATLPNHLCRVSWRTSGMPLEIESRYPTFEVFHRGYRSPTLPPPVNVQCSQTEAIFKGPGMFTLTVERVAADVVPPTGSEARVRAAFGTPERERDIIVETVMSHAGAKPDELARWEALPLGIRVW